MMDDAWEAIRWVPMDDLITATKVRGSAAILSGRTTPEGWPFVVLVAIGKPGSERVLDFAREFSAKMAEAGAPPRVANDPNKEPVL